MTSALPSADRPMRMSIQIMVPLDGSEKDGRALAVATAVAHLSGGGLHLVHVLDASERAEDDAGSARALAGERLAASAGRLSIDASLTSAVLEGKHVVDELVQHATECGALAVVMGTRAPRAVGRVVVGSVADRVMRECPKPVVLVPPRAEFLEGKHIQFGRVLVPLDGSALAAKALEFLLRLPHASELEWVLLEVVRPAEDAEATGGSSALESGSRLVAESEERLEVAAAHVRARGVSVVEVQVVEDLDPAAAIVAAVRDYLVELIAMSTRGTGGLRRLALGSTAEGVVRASEIPVLLMTPATLAAG